MLPIDKNSCFVISQYNEKMLRNILNRVQTYFFLFFTVSNGKPFSSHPKVCATNRSLLCCVCICKQWRDITYYDRLTHTIAASALNEHCRLTVMQHLKSFGNEMRCFVKAISQFPLLCLNCIS